MEPNFDLTLENIVGRFWKWKLEKFIVKGHKIISGGKLCVFTSLRTIVMNVEEKNIFLSALIEITPKGIIDRTADVKKPAAWRNPIVEKKAPANSPPPPSFTPDAKDWAAIKKKTQSENSIYMDIKETSDYGKFESILGNRPLNKSKIDKIVKDVQSGFNMLPYFPIIVSLKEDRFKIIDGQHRFQVSQITNEPVYYLECNHLTLKQIAQLNSRGEKWKITDFLNCYIRLETADYTKVQEIMNEFGTNIKVTADLLMFNMHLAKSTEAFQDGTFKCNFEKETRELLSVTTTVFKDYFFCTDRYLIGAVKELIRQDLCDFEKLKKKLAAAPTLLTRQANTKAFLQNIETVYNYNNSKREVIYQ